MANSVNYFNVCNTVAAQAESAVERPNHSSCALLFFRAMYVEIRNVRRSEGALAALNAMAVIERRNVWTLDSVADTATRCKIEETFNNFWAELTAIVGKDMNSVRIAQLPRKYTVEADGRIYSGEAW